jgi:hypothetical protein
MPAHESLGPDDRENLQDRRKPAIVILQPDPALNPTPQYDQLPSERCILSLKPALRLEWRGQDGQDEV